MRKLVPFPRPALLTRVSIACVLAASVSACGSDSVRLAENPFSNPFNTSSRQRVADPVATGSIGNAGGEVSTGTGFLSSPVQSQPLPPVASKPLAGASLATTTATPRPPAALATTGSLQKTAGVAGSAAGWSATGGTPVTLATGESVNTLSNRYGVPVSAILAANGLAAGANPPPGTRIIIPVYSASARSAGAQVAQASSPSSAPTPPVASAVEGAREKARLAAEAKLRSEAQARIDAAEARATAAEARAKADQQALKAAGQTRARPSEAKSSEAKSETAAKTGQKPAVVTRAEAASKAKADDTAKIQAQAKLAEAKIKAEAKAKAEAEAKAKVEAKAKTIAEAKARTKVASLPAASDEPKTTSSVSREAIAKEAPVKETVKAEPAEKAPSADFRWPARGRVITGFSGKGGNEGINIAVPEGTPVKAAEGGTVAYSGNELKGYGNLVLIRHDNGYVSAYAHNGDISVKRGEKVARGQVIAKSGQSGNVSSPQLHFELRKGSNPVDPMLLLDN